MSGSLSWGGVRWPQLPGGRMAAKQRGSPLKGPWGSEESLQGAAGGHHRCFTCFYPPASHKTSSQGAWSQIRYEELSSHFYLRMGEQKRGAPQNQRGDSSHRKHQGRQLCPAEYFWPRWPWQRGWSGRGGDTLPSTIDTASWKDAQGSSGSGSRGGLFHFCAACRRLKSS